MTVPTQTRLTLREAFDDLGWFYATFLALVGGPSLLEILEMIVQFRLVDALQWIVDGYRLITTQMGALIEPLLQPALAWLSETFNWRLELHAHWRPVFLLAMVFVMGLVRTVLRESMFEAVLFGLLLSLGALVGSIAAGLNPLEGGWWVQGLAAAAPVASVCFLLGAPLAITTAGGPRALPNPLRALGEVAALTLVLSALTFALAAGVSFIPAVSRGAGLVTLGVGVFAIGLVSLLAGLEQADRINTRVGLTVIGGFVTAALVVIVDSILKALGG